MSLKGCTIELLIEGDVSTQTSLSALDKANNDEVNIKIHSDKYACLIDTYLHMSSMLEVLMLEVTFTYIHNINKC